MIRWQPLKLGGKSSDTKVTKVLVSQVGRGWPWLAIGQMLLILIHHITTPPDIDTDTSLSSIGYSSYNRWDHKLALRCNTPVEMKPLWPTEQHQKMKRFKRMKPNKHQDVSIAMLVNTYWSVIFIPRG